jgi:ABC-type lipoprotein release transport system permease subunit
VGKIIEFLLSIYALINGVGTITIINMPILFAIFIILLSFFVGVITGIYPAKRATKISALNALRYE